MVLSSRSAPLIEAGSPLLTVVAHHAAGAAAQRTFIQHVGGRSITYAEAHQEIGNWARSFRAHGLGRGDRVIIALESSPNSVLALARLRCSRRGGDTT